MSEAKLWTTVKNGVGHVGHWDRIESHATSQGRPDVNWCLTGSTVDIELKNYDAKKKFTLRPNQNAWMIQRVKAGGSVFVLAKFDSTTGPIYLLIPGTRSRELIASKEYEAWHKQAIWVWENKIDWEIFTRLVHAGMETEAGNPNSI